MAKLTLNKAEQKLIDDCIALCEASTDQFDSMASGLVGNLRTHSDLKEHIHFIKYRIKDPDHLRRKLEGKALERKQQLRDKKKKIAPEINPDNFFKYINDVIGVRVIYLHTGQMPRIHAALLDFFDVQQFKLMEKPTASCWDYEYEKMYKRLGIKTRATTGYSSVHYVIQVNKRTRWTCEIQVRTLTDEVWGEVSHLVNYPDESPSEVCQEQLKTLARFTTGCTRLVDTIFRVDGDARAD
ncbi:MAG: (p)ppGpp synthetase [Phycisphaerales bacterium]